MLLLVELVRMEVCETTDNGDGGQLWLGRQPALDQRVRMPSKLDPHVASYLHR
jgi:hypothetical protein